MTCDSSQTQHHVEISRRSLKEPDEIWSWSPITIGSNGRRVKSYFRVLPGSLAILAAVALSGMSAVPPEGDPQPGASLAADLAEDSAFRKAVADPTVGALVADMLEAVEDHPANGSIGWTWLPFDDIEWEAEAVESEEEPSLEDFDQLTEEQAEDLTSALGILAATTGTTYYCGAGSYRVAYSHAFDDNLYALCRSGVGTHSVNVFSTGGRTAVCPWNTRGHVYWEGGAYTPRWSTIRGPVSSMYTCYYFGTYNVKITQVKIYSCTGTCPV